MKKFKTKNLFLTALAILCAVVLGCAVSLSVGLFNKSKTAHAAGNQATITFGAPLYYGGYDYSAAISNADMVNSLPSYISYNQSGLKVETTITSNGAADFQRNSAIAVPVILNFTVAPYSISTVSYHATMSNSGRYGREHGLIGGWKTGTTGGFNYSGANFASGVPSTNIDGQWSASFFGSNPESNSFTVYNDTGVEKVCHYNSFYFAHRGDHVNTYSFSYEFDSIEVDIAKIESPVANGSVSEVYDETTKTFSFDYIAQTYTDNDGNVINYDTAYKNIEATIEAVDYNGNTLNASSFNLSTTNSGGTLTAKEAGKYKVKFNLKQTCKFLIC